MPKRKYKINDIVDDMKIIGFSDKKNYGYIVECIICGRQKEMRGARLSSHTATKHSKCIFNKEKRLYYSRLYKIWAGIRSRTTNPNNHAYKHYGGRGIKSEAFTNFTDFYNSMAKAYENAIREYGKEANISIDRIDVNGGYCPENCRWIPLAAQQGNRRTNKNFVAQDQSKNRYYAKNISEFAREHDLNGSTIHDCLQRKIVSYKRWIFYYEDTEEEYVNFLNEKQNMLLRKIEITSPDEMAYHISYYMLNSFCKEHDLDRQGPIRCLKGVYKQYKGWKFIYSNKKCNDYPKAQKYEQ